MREHKETVFHERGRATAPPGVCYTLPGSTSEEYSYTLATTSTSTNLVGQSLSESIQSPQYLQNYTNFVQQKNQISCSTSDCLSPCSESLCPTTLSKSISSNSSVNSSEYNSNCSSTHFVPSSFSSPTNFSVCNSINNISGSSGDNNICDNNIDCSSALKNLSRSQQSSSFLTQDDVKYVPGDQSSLFNYSKVSKANSGSSLKHTSSQSNFANFFSNQLKCTPGQEALDSESDKGSKSKKDFELFHRNLKALKEDDPDISFCIEDWQQFISKQRSKIKQASEASQELVTDSLLQFLQKKTQEKNCLDSFSYDLSDASQLLVSLCNKHKSEELSALKKKEINEDSKLMNDFLSKILLEKEDKKFKFSDEKKKIVRKELFDDFNNEFDEKIKRDAMSQYQEDKTHHKRSANYNELNQWDYLNQQGMQNPNNHNRRGPFSFGGTSQAHSIGWNPMGMGMSRQTNPYYSNPHSHMMPAHAHAEYRYNQWNNPNQKAVPNIHNAHSQNTILPQARMDLKHNSEISNPVTDFALPGSQTADFSKLRTSPRDILLRPTLPDKSSRLGIHSDHLASVPPSIKNSTVRPPSLTAHQKTVISNPLSDLQMLVTNQKNENPPQKADSYQQESVDLSAHSDSSKYKENSNKNENKVCSENNIDKKECNPPISVKEFQNKHIFNKMEEMFEKPVELTSKNSEKYIETEISSSIRFNNLENSCSSVSNVADNNLKENEKESAGNAKNVENFKGISVIVENEENKLSNVEECKEQISNISESTSNTCNTILQKEKDKEKEVEIRKDSPVVDNSQEASQDTNKSEQKGEENEKQQILLENKNSDNTLAETSDKSEKDMNGSQSSKRKSTNEQQLGNESKRTFLEVESQLEKMFGVSEDNGDLPTVSSTSTEVRPSISDTSKKTPKKKQSRKSRAFRLSSAQSSSSDSQFCNKKFKTLNKTDDKKKLKKSVYDSADRRGPVLHIEGTRDSPYSVTVINCPKGDDEDEKDRGVYKKPSLNSSRLKHHNELDYRGKSKNGLFSSTLSSRYDAHTTDHSWVCVFCKKGPHFNAMGDLFGPYIISKDESSTTCDFSGDEKDISDAQKRGGRNKKSLRANNMVEHFQKMSKKLRRTQSNDSCLDGMTVIPDDQTDQLRYEVWVHEQCAVWSPNVCLVGSRIIGMQEAIWSSVKTMCSKCGSFGANIGCVFRNCPNRSHYHCAKENGWSLEQETFISTCHIHKPRS